MSLRSTTISPAADTTRSAHASDTAAEQHESMGAAIATCASMLRAADDRLTTEDIEALRGLSLDAPDERLLHRVLRPLGLVDSPGWIEQRQWNRKWAALLKGMAICAGLHDPTVPLGEALARTDWPEERFTRMMEARNGQLPTFIEWAARHLAGEKQAVNWDDVRRLLFKSGDHAKQLRLRIANDYFRTVYAIRRRSI